MAILEFLHAVGINIDKNADPELFNYYSLLVSKIMQTVKVQN